MKDVNDLMQAILEMDAAQRSQAAEAMTAAAKAHEAEWCAALVQRTLGGEAAQ